MFHFQIDPTGNDPRTFSNIAYIANRCATEVVNKFNDHGGCGRPRRTKLWNTFINLVAYGLINACNTFTVCFQVVAHRSR